VNNRRSVCLFMAVASSWLACGDLLGLGPRPESWPPEGGRAPEPGLNDAARPAVEASNETANDASDAGPTPDAPPSDLAEAASPVSDADTSFPAVGFVTGVSSPVAATHPGATDRTNERLAASTLSCSGVLIASRTVLTAASCLASNPLQTYFALNPTGDALGRPDRTMVYAIDGAHLSPSGQAILHLAVASDQPEPASIAAPLVPVTANDANPSPFGWHSPAPPFENGAAMSQTASWRIESATTVVRRVRSGDAVPLGDAGVQFTVPTSSPSFSSDLGAPAIAQAGGRVIGSLDQSAPPSLIFVATFASAEGSWLEQMLWRYDEVIVPNIALPPPPGGYTWIGVSDVMQDPGSLDVAQPTAFYAAGSEVVYDPSGSQTRALGICVAWTSGGQLPGKYWINGGCAFDSNGSESWASVYKVLSVTGTASWSQAPGGVVATGSFAAGYSAMMPVFACHASYMSGVQPGFVRGGSCYITWGGQEQAVSPFETLVLGP
jgi:hypothetical protein